MKLQAHLFREASMVAYNFLAPEKDVYLFMGTMYKFQRWNVANSWTIIGVAPFPHVEAR